MTTLAATILLIAAGVTAYGAVVYVSLALGFAAAACALGAAAIVLFARSRRTAAAAPPREALVDACGALAPPPGLEVESASASATAVSPEAPPRDLVPVTPRALDAPSVLEALLLAVAPAGDAVRATLWRGDGAGESAAFPVATSGEHREDLVRSRDTVHEVLREERALLDSLTLPDPGSADVTTWRYVVPITFSGMKGAVGLDFLGDRPNLEILNRTAAAYRVPLAAALALQVAERESAAASALVATVRELTRLLDPDQIAQTALARALEVGHATTGSVMLYDEAGADLRIAAAVGLPDDVVSSTIVRAGDGIAGWVALSCQPLVVEDTPGDAPRVRSRGIRSAVSVPIADSEGVLGVLNAGAPEHPSRLASGDLAVLETIAAETAAALRNARSAARATDIYFETLMAFATAIESKDPYADGQTERVVRHVADVARELGLEPSDIRTLELAAILRDIGMPSGCEDTYASRESLSPVERNLITLHPVIAAEILNQAPALREVAPVVYHHHERYDGSGYPEGLAGDGIPLGARILSAADAFVAMTSRRPHREAYAEDEALAELEKGTGTQFDRAVVDALVATRSATSDRLLGSTR
ncbi:MAG TPA: HD domain-containing phosphohydrolase [Coriobacteriia bacterium]|nr:HD domain-containing phosphohydrolase [Coriobacteriia bacterium]